MKTNLFPAVAVAALALSACNPEAEEAPVTSSAEAAAAETSNGYTEIETPEAATDLEGRRYRTDVVNIYVAPAGDADGGDKLEFKVRMSEGDVIVYDWTAQGASDFWHEFHGHTEDTVAFYEKAEGTEHQGAMTAPFDGIQGWYYENRSAQPVEVRLRMAGFYELVAEEE